MNIYPGKSKPGLTVGSPVMLKVQSHNNHDHNNKNNSNNSNIIVEMTFLVLPFHFNNFFENQLCYI